MLIETPAGKAVLVDGGEPEAGPVILSYLKALDVQRLALLVITHPHADHIGGLLDVIRALPVARVWADGQVHTSNTYEELLTLIDRHEIPFRPARAGMETDIGGLHLRVLHPSEPFLEGLNNNSVTLQASYRHIRLLLVGDLEAEGERQILERAAARGVPLGSTWMQVAHHGSESSTTSAWLEAVRPEVAVIQSGVENSYGHPHAEVLQRLRLVDPPVRLFRNDLHGTVILTTDGQGYTVETEREAVSDTVWKPGPGAASDVKTPRSQRGNDDEPAATFAKRVNLNTATLGQLEALPGIGPVIAARIVEYRKEHPFAKVNELLHVKGIGPKRLEGLLPLVTIE